MMRTTLLANDLFPNGVVYSTHTMTAGGTYAPVTGKITIPLLNIGSSSILTIKANVGYGQPCNTTNIANIASAKEFDPVTSNNISSVYFHKSGCPIVYLPGQQLSSTGNIFRQARY